MFHIPLPGRKSEPPAELPKPIRRRKKKEEVKPWGKLERIIVFIFLVSAPIFSFLFLAQSKNSKNPLPAPIAPQIINNIIPTTSKNIDDLKESLINETQNLKGTYGIWFETVNGKYKLGINEKEIFDGASLFKLPLMIAYYKKVDSGQINPNTTYSLRYSDGASGAGIIANMPAGTSVTYHNMIEAMGKNSDNAAFQIMGRILGWNSADKVIDEIGMTNTSILESLTTPYDTGLLFSKLVNNKLLSNSSKDELLNFLTNTDFETLIPKGIPSGIKISHKFGTDTGELNDAGIIYSNSPFILVILSKDINYGEAQIEIPKLTEIVYNWVSGVK